MSPCSPLEREKNELDAVLASGILSRAPNLEHLLRYICEKHFEGAAGDIKEYNIAVDAFGRPPEFDQKRDSIVRVEAHRLRRRLKEFYEGEGAGHAIHISIPSGQYAPRFSSSAAEVESAELVGPQAGVVPVPMSTELVPPSPPTNVVVSGYPRAPRGRAAIVMTLAALAVTAAAVGLESMHYKPKAPAPILSIPADPGAEIRILAGVTSGSYVDALERTWQSDRYFAGGRVEGTPRTHPVAGTRDQQMYQFRRDGTFQYAIPLKPGPYELRLYFAETVFGDNNAAGGGETSRIFDVSANGKPILEGFDVIGDAGSAVADVKVFKGITAGADGKLHLEFTAGTNGAFVNAIELVPTSVAGQMLPIRIVARDRGVKDSKGLYWDPDRWAQGGQLISRPESSATAAERELYLSERFGNLTYVIPVAQPGKYSVNLYFMENWFGPGMPGGGGAGDRIFDILVNGVAVRRNFDIFKEAGGRNETTTVRLHGVEANHQGKVVISLTPVRNYACINALEVLDEGQ